MIDQSSDRRDAFRQRLKQVEAFLEPALTPLGLEVIYIEQTGAARRAVLRISIDRIQAPGTVSVEDCATASRLFQDAPELDALFSGPWDLEFSSPGVDRPLVRTSDYDRYVGDRAVVYSDVLVEGRSKFSGRLLGLVDGQVGVDAGREGRFWIALTNIRKAHLKPDFADLLKRAEARNPQPELLLAEDEETDAESSAEAQSSAGAESSAEGAGVSSGHGPKAGKGPKVANASRAGNAFKAGKGPKAVDASRAARDAQAPGRRDRSAQGAVAGDVPENSAHSGRKARDLGRRERFGGATSSQTPVMGVESSSEQEADEA